MKKMTLAVLAVMTILLTGCVSTGNGMPDFENSLRETAELTFEKHFPSHDPEDMDRSFNMIVRETEAGDLHFRGTTEFSEGYMSSTALPLDAGHGIYVTMTVEGELTEGVGTPNPAFIDLFFTGSTETALPELGSLFIRYEQQRDTGSQGLVGFSFDGMGSFASIYQGAALADILGKRITFIVYWDEAETRWAYRTEGELGLQGHFSSDVGPAAFADGAYLLLAGDRNGQSPDSILIHEVGTITW